MLGTKCDLQSDSLRGDQNQRYVDWTCKENNCQLNTMTYGMPQRPSSEKLENEINISLEFIASGYWISNQLHVVPAFLAYWQLQEERQLFIPYYLEHVYLSQEGGKVSLGRHGVCLRLEPGNISYRKETCTVFSQGFFSSLLACLVQGDHLKVLRWQNDICSEKAHLFIFNF